MGPASGVTKDSACRGITNGINVNEWNPATDPYLPAAVRYSQATAATGKAAAKALFQQKQGLKVDPSTPLVAMIGRLTLQKGTDVLLAALPALLDCVHVNTAEPAVIGSVICGHCNLGSQSSSKPLQLALLGTGCSQDYKTASYVVNLLLTCDQSLFML